MSLGEKQTLPEFTANLDAQTRRYFGMGVEKFKILKNLGLAILVAFVGLETGMDPYHIITIILAVGSPDALELFLGNGVGPDFEGKDDDE